MITFEPEVLSICNNIYEITGVRDSIAHLRVFCVICIVLKIISLYCQRNLLSHT